LEGWMAWQMAGSELARWWTRRWTRRMDGRMDGRADGRK
jgi:hypothetical protein